MDKDKAATALRIQESAFETVDGNREIISSSEIELTYSINNTNTKQWVAFTLKYDKEDDEIHEVYTSSDLPGVDHFRYRSKEYCNAAALAWNNAIEAHVRWLYPNYKRLINAGYDYINACHPVDPNEVYPPIPR